MKDSIQQHLAQIRRNQILDAATTVFSQQGYHATTIKQIATEAGVADGTIYNYFDNKTALLLGIFDRMRDIVQPEGDEIAKLIDGDLRTFLTAFLQMPMQTLNQDDFQLFRVVVSEMMTNDDLRQLYYEHILEPTLAIAENYLQAWAQQRQIDDLDIALTVRSLSGLVMGLMIQHVMGDKTLQSKWNDLPDFVANLLINGLEHNPS